MRVEADFKFIHCADLHLDSQFKGVAALDEDWAGEMRESTFTALDRLVGTAHEKGVDFIIIAGDIFDSGERSVRAQFRFRDAMEKVGIPCYIACGNHDPLDQWSGAVPLPENVRRFDTEPETFLFRREGRTLAAVSGISYPHREVREDLSALLEPVPGEFNIAVLHCNVGSTAHESYSPTTKDALISKGFDYWGLGHVHERRMVNEDPWIVYPGNTQGRHVNETGEKGCQVVTVRSGRVDGVEFVPLQAFEWRRVEADISGHEDLDSLIDSVTVTGDGVIAEVEFIGRGPLDALLRDQEAARQTAERLCELSGSKLSRHRVATRPPVDLDAISQGHDLMAAILRTADGMDGAEDIRRRLLEVKGASRFKEWLDALGEDGLSQLVEEAALLLADRLMEEGG